MAWYIFTNMPPSSIGRATSATPAGSLSAPIDCTSAGVRKSITFWSFSAASFCRSASVSLASASARTSLPDLTFAPS